MEVGKDGTICGHHSFPGAESWRSSGYVLKRRHSLVAYKRRKT